MIDHFPVSNKTEYFWLLDYIESQRDMDFYYTKDNNRIYVNDYASLKTFLRESICIFVKKERGDYRGIVLVWKSVGGGISRYYVKLIADSPKHAKDLLTILLWNCNKELYVKVRKDSKLYYAYKDKGFHFCGARGIQILLNRKYIPMKPTFFKQEDEEKEVKHK